MKPHELLDAAKAGLGVTGDSELGKALGWASGKVSQYRTDKKWPNNDSARLLAEAAGLNPVEVIVSLEIARASDEATRTAWGKALAQLRSRAGYVELGLLPWLAAGAAAYVSGGFGRALAALTIIPENVDNRPTFAEVLEGSATHGRKSGCYNEPGRRAKKHRKVTKVRTPRAGGASGCESRVAAERGNSVRRYAPANSNRPA